jgi:hypothetical protein
MHTVWQQHYIRGFLAIAVALALPWSCVVHCAPQMQPAQHSQFVCDMTQTTPTIASAQQFTTNTHLPSALHVAILIGAVFFMFRQPSHRYTLLIPVLFGIHPTPALRPPQFHPRAFSF